ncbi:methyltransferase family protein [Nitratireductor sp. GCM10026969]|uniref:methyltransferase family protein n=1 Tax=Nitratireductor sp. GCM10026969 TaxID=3252645 RepID=UPI0036190BF3
MATSTAPQPFDQRKRIRFLWAGGALVAAAMVLSDSAWSEATGAHEAVEVAGIGLVFICILGRLWSTLYIGSRKNQELATRGPYSMTRNPLYFFSTIGAAGVGLMFGSLFMGVLLAFITYRVFLLTAAREEAFLRGRFGRAYADYADRTPLFWPIPRLYEDDAEVGFSPSALKRTLLDGLYFLAIFPVLELVEQLHFTGYLPYFLSLY